MILPAGPARRSPNSRSAMLELSRDPRNWSVEEPARRIEMIGTGLNMRLFDPSNFGAYSPPTPTITFQVPEAGGTTGSSNGGAGSVNAGCAIAGPHNKIDATKIRSGGLDLTRNDPSASLWKAGQASNRTLPVCFIRKSTSGRTSLLPTSSLLLIILPGTPVLVNLIGINPIY